MNDTSRDSGEGGETFIKSQLPFATVSGGDFLFTTTLGLRSQSEGPHWYSSSIASVANAANIWMSGIGSFPDAIANKYRGYSLRCVYP